MMNSGKIEFSHLEQPIEIYENQRMWIGRGFSTVGLLPTERGPYSTKDGSLSWKTMQDASLALLRGDVTPNNAGGMDSKKGFGRKNGKLVASTNVKRIRRGWSFHEEDSSDHPTDRNDNDKENLRREDEYECSSNHSDGDVAVNYCGFVPCTGPEDGRKDSIDGWQYFPDFTPQSLLSPNRKRGILDFVRRRKLRRVAIFRPDHFLPREVCAKCDYCDSNIVNMLSNAMLDAIALATLFAHGPKNNITDAQVLPLKSKLIDSLSIGTNCSHGSRAMAHQSSSSSDNDSDYDPFVDILKVKDRLRNFAETCVGKPGSVRQLLNPDVSDQNLISAMPGRRKVAERYLTERERVCLARLLIKDVDRHSFQFHCRNESCSCIMMGGSQHSNNDSSYRIDDDDDDTKLPDCEFRLVPCPNLNCPDQFSHKHRMQHDEECGFKLVPCPSECGANIPKNEVHIHVRDQCILRSAECPLSIVGCTATVRAKDVASHLNEHADQHFILMANRMMEYQNVMKDMNARLKSLEEKNVVLESELKRAKVQLQSKSEAKTVANNVKKLTKRIGTLETTCRKEFKLVEHDRKNR
mmetsp:Transcript_23611/g.50971  ORF Transcript_23611/g.50971 Transcript_23611/m.50971 type:complete len:580 (-) Transcript_23611:40-1779(-)